MIFRDEVTAAQARVDRLRRQLTEAQEQLDSARALLAEAVADGRERDADRLRSTVARLVQKTTELEAAVPVAQRRLSEARKRAAERTRAQRPPGGRTRSSPGGPRP